MYHIRRKQYDRLSQQLSNSRVSCSRWQSALYSRLLYAFGYTDTLRLSTTARLLVGYLIWLQNVVYARLSHCLLVTICRLPLLPEWLGLRTQIRRSLLCIRWSIAGRDARRNTRTHHIRRRRWPKFSSSSPPFHLISATGWPAIYRTPRRSLTRISRRSICLSRNSDTVYNELWQWWWW